MAMTYFLVLNPDVLMPELERIPRGGDRASHLVQNMFHIYFSRNVPFRINIYHFTKISY